MSVSANDRRYGPVTLSGAGETINADFRIQADADALVWFYDSSAGTYAALTLNTDYTITSRTSSGFNVVLGAAVGASGDKVWVLDKASTAGQITLTTGDSLPPETLQEQGLDHLYERIQRLEEMVQRTLQFPPETTKKTTPDQTTVTTQVPDYSTSDASKVLALNSAGDAMVWSTPTDASAITVTSFAETLLDDTTAAAARTTLAAAADADVIKKDGSVAFTGDQSMGSNKLTNVTDPTSAQDAATMNYVDTQLAATHYADPDKYVFFSDDFLFPTSDPTDGTQGPWEEDMSGAGAAVAPASAAVAAHPGILTLDAGTTTTGFAEIIASSGSGTEVLALGGGVLTFSATVKVPTLPTAGEDFELWIGLGDTGENNGVYFFCSGSGQANWLATSEASGTATQTDTSTAMTTDWVTLKAVVNAAGTSVGYYIDGSLVATNTTNIPTAEISPKIRIKKSAGTTSRTLQVDLFWLKQTLTTSR